MIVKLNFQGVMAMTYQHTTADILSGLVSYEINVLIAESVHSVGGQGLIPDRSRTCPFVTTSRWTSLKWARGSLSDDKAYTAWNSKL